LKVPDEISLMSLFECDPKMVDEGISFFYNESTYRFSNSNNEEFLVVICPSYGDIKVQVTIEDTNEIISIMEFGNVESIEILCDKKNESKIMITSEHSVIKINFKPKFKLFVNQF
jgi:hypothetical protein